MQTNIAVALVQSDQYAAAEPVLTECVKLARSLGDDHLVAVNLGNLAIAVYEQGDVDRAASLRGEALALARSVGDSFLVSESLNDQGRAEYRDGKLQSAAETFLESLILARQLADPVATIWALECFAELATAKHAHERATMILGAVATLREAIGLRNPPREEHKHKRVTAAARAALGDAAFDRTWRGGGEMSLDEAVRYALSDQDAVDNATE